MGNAALSSLHSLEEMYRQNAAQVPPLEPQRAVWAGTALAIAEVPLLIAEGELGGIVETPPAVPIPGTQPWVIGAATHMGTLLPVLSGDVFFRRAPYVGRAREFSMLVRRQGYRFAMTLSSVQQDLKFSLDERDMEHPVDADFAQFSLGGFHHHDRFLAILDIDKLVSDPRFVDAAANVPVQRGMNDEA